jgi:hypothetical protein
LAAFEHVERHLARVAKNNEDADGLRLHAANHRADEEQGPSGGVYGHVKSAVHNWRGLRLLL